MISLKKILVATDFGEASEAALTYGRTLAKAFDATLHVLHVTENIYFTPFGAEGYMALAPDLQRDIEDTARRRLHELVIDSDNSGPPTVTALACSNTPALPIVDYAREHGMDLIVMGTHGRGAMAHLVMGSVAERVVRLASCPVLTVRHPEHEFVLPDALAAVAHV